MSSESSESPYVAGEGNEVLDMMLEMEALAESAEWQRVEDIAVRLKSAVLAVPVARRRDTLLAVRRSMANVKALAERERASVADKLSQIHRGRQATEAYGTNAREPLPASARGSRSEQGPK